LGIKGGINSPEEKESLFARPGRTANKLAKRSNEKALREKAFQKKKGVWGGSESSITLLGALSVGIALLNQELILGQKQGGSP